MINDLGYRFRPRLDVPVGIEPKSIGFSPSDIPGLIAWYAARLETVYVNNDPVGIWTDRSGNGNNATQAGGKRPLYITGVINGHPVIRFDGVDDALYANAVAASFSGDDMPMTIYGVIKWDALANWKYCWSFGNSADNDTWTAFRKSNVPQYQYSRSPDAGGEVNVIGPNADLLWHIHSYILNGTQGTPSVDGVPSATQPQNVGVVTLDRLTFGAQRRIGEGAWMDCDMAEWLIYSTIHNATQRTQIEDYLNGFYAIY